MSDSFSQFTTTEIERRTYRVEYDFSREDEIHGHVVARQNFVTNYASLESLRNIFLFVFYALLADYGDKSATLHDWLYSGFGIEKATGHYYPTRKEADEIFYRALRAEGIAKWRAGMFYYGVRLFGAKHFVNEQLVWAGGPALHV